MLEVRDAEVLYRYGDPFYTDFAAVTRKRHGPGTALPDKPFRPGQELRLDDGELGEEDRLVAREVRLRRPGRG